MPDSTAGDADRQTPELRHARLTELFLPRGIRRSRHRAEVKLFAEYLWLRAGCCHRVFDFHPNELYPIGLVDPRTGEKLLAEVTDIGWAKVLAGRCGRRRPVTVTQQIWEAPNLDPRQGRLFQVPADIPPEPIGRDPRLVVPHLLPLALLEDESVDPAHKLVGLFLLSAAGLCSWEVTFHVATVAKELGRHPKQIRESVKKLDGRYWDVLECSNGYIRLRFLDALYLPHQKDETRLVANAQPSVAAGYLPLYDGQQPAPGKGAHSAHGTPEHGAHGAHDTPQSGASYAHGTPEDGAHGAHRAPQSGASYAHGTPEYGAHGAHGTPKSGASYAHGTPLSAPILSLSESNLIRSDPIGIRRIEERARQVTCRLKRCTGMKAFMPILFAILVELGELDEKTVWDDIERANNAKEPAPFLTGIIKRQVAPDHVTENYAREVFQRFNIVWSSDLTGPVVKSVSARSQAEADEREKRRTLIIIEGRKAGKTVQQINEELAREGLEGWVGG